MGNTTVIRAGDVQVMSAGTGVFHSEFNRNHDKEVKFLQIWVFPNRKNVEPRYDQVSIREIEKENEFSQVLSPDADDDGVWIYQDAWFSIGNFTKDAKIEYRLKNPDNGIYFFVLEGKATIEGQELEQRDGFGVWETGKILVEAKQGSGILLMEVPMTA
jgi:redox-sensitive bicupin YhaK (pirin superfamily)